MDACECCHVVTDDLHGFNTPSKRPGVMLTFELCMGCYQANTNARLGMSREEYRANAIAEATHRQNGDR